MASEQLVRPGRECNVIREDGNMCGENRLAEMVKYSANTDGHQKRCRGCANAKRRAWTQTKLADDPDYARNYHYQRRGLQYGLTIAEYDELFAAYDGMCYSCKETPATDVDHDHSCCIRVKSCGVCVRGVLCRHCNLILGLAKDDADRLRQAIEYLETY